MIKTRCGLNCENCRFYQAGSCTGCIAQSAPPWGKCPVKGCCEGRGQEHCGVCGDFACRLLQSFAWDEREGDDGAASVAAVSGRRMGNSVKEQNVPQGGESRAQFRAWPEKHGSDDAECRVKVRKGRPRGSAGHGSGELPV